MKDFSLKLDKIPIYKDYKDISQQMFSLTLELVKFEGEDLFFLCDFSEDGYDNLVACAGLNSNNLYILNGEYIKSTIKTDEAGVVGKLRNGFFIDSENLLVQTAPPCKLYMLNIIDNGCIEVEAGKKPWHGAWSIAKSNFNNVIMYSEYTTTKDNQAEELYVWRSYDNGLTWEKSLVLSSSPVYGIGDIRHFHTCYSDPYINGRWYVSSGDKGSDNRLYVTEDDGVNWKRIFVKDIYPFRLIEEKEKDSVLRYTSLIISRDKLSWATDDQVGVGRSLYCSINKEGLFNNKGVNVSIDAVLSENLSRNVIRVPGIGVLVLPETKHDPKSAAVNLFNGEGLYQFPRITSLSKQRSAFLSSRSSRCFCNGLAFGLVDRFFLNNESPGTVLIKLKKEQTFNSYPSLMLKDEKIKKDKKVVFFHAQRTAGTTLKRLFETEYGKGNCLFYRNSDDYKSWEDIDKDIFSKYSVYAGHANYSYKESDDDRDFFYMSIIRNPYERAISIYNYLRSRDSGKISELAKNNDMFSFFKKAYIEFPDYISNTQTLRVSGCKDFLLAKEIVDKEYSMLAPFDRLDDVVGVLAKCLSWKKVTGLEIKPSTIDFEFYENEELKRYIYDINREDFMLYEYSKLFFSVIESGYPNS